MSAAGAGIVRATSMRSVMESILAGIRWLLSLFSAVPQRVYEPIVI
jgi:hypothetical protein